MVTTFTTQALFRLEPAQGSKGLGCRPGIQDWVWGLGFRVALAVSSLGSLAAAVRDSGKPAARLTLAQAFHVFTGVQ